MNDADKEVTRLFLLTNDAYWAESFENAIFDANYKKKNITHAVISSSLELKNELIEEMKQNDLQETITRLSAQLDEYALPEELEEASTVAKDLDILLKARDVITLYKKK